MKLSHECPIDILSTVQQYTDYDYCLLHMLLSDPVYREWFSSQARKEYLILDNSAYELGAGLTGDKIVEGYNLIKPEYVVAPDVVKDTYTTIENFKEFKEKYGSKVGKIGGVVQGKTWNEFVNCLNFMFENADLVMIPAGIFKQGLDRVTTIYRAKAAGYWREDKPVHLLGCKELQEYHFYDSTILPNIISTDTSSPVQYAIETGLYPENILDYAKPKNMVDYNHKTKNPEIESIISNIKSFKNFFKEEGL